MKRLLLLLLILIPNYVYSQCAGQLEPGFTFLSSSRGCAPFTANIETLYLSSPAGTTYYVNWGDGTPEQTIVQTNSTGVIFSHTYPVSPTNCGYNVTIDASNACNPRGSVIPITTSVIVWTDDQVVIQPTTYRVCAGFATDVTFTDNSNWNCFPRATRENDEFRWLQWQYGVGPASNQIAGITINNITPSTYPYLNPAAGTNPIYPVNAPGAASLTIDVPVTTTSDIGKEFVVRLRNWNQCNAYDDNIIDGNGLNPVTGDLINGDNDPRNSTARIVIVAAPTPNFITRLNNNSGQIRSNFCINDNIFFDNLTTPIAGANLMYRWEFYDDATASSLINTSTQVEPTYSYSTSGTKLIRLYVRDSNAFGNCENFIDVLITVSTALQAEISTTDSFGNIITSDFCQNVTAPFQNFQVTFNDITSGVVTATTEFRWEFYDTNNNLIESIPSVGFSSTRTISITKSFSDKGSHRVVLLIRDNSTSCLTSRNVTVNIYENPVANFNFNTVCEYDSTTYYNLSTHNSYLNDIISNYYWDFNYNNTFTTDLTTSNLDSVNVLMPNNGIFNVALVAETSVGCTDTTFSNVNVLAAPISIFNVLDTAFCSSEVIRLYNNSILNQPDLIDRYVWQINRNDGLGFVDDSVQRLTDLNFSNYYDLTFVNNSSIDNLYQIRLITYTINGCFTISDHVSLRIFPAPTAIFNSLNYFPFNDNCSPISVDFQVAASTRNLNPSFYTWQIINSNLDTLINIVSTDYNFNYNFINTSFNQIQDFQVRLITNFNSGCSNSSSQTVRVNPVPNATFNIDTLIIDCDIIRLRAIAIQSGLTYNWNVTNNAVTILSQNSTLNFIELDVNRQNFAQDIQFNLTAINFSNCFSSSSNNLNVPILDNFNINFQVTPTSQTLPSSTIDITNLTPFNSNHVYLWNFGDNSISNLYQPALHEYSTYGTYNVTLITQAEYCSDTLSRSIRILPYPAVLDFDWKPSVGCSPVQVIFNSTYQYIRPETIEWIVDFQIYNQDNLNISFTESGNYLITLRAIDLSGNIVEITKDVNIEVYSIPISRFTVRSIELYAQTDQLYVRNLSQNATNYLWNFGDGVTSTEVEPVHVYSNAGEYVISLIAYNSFGCSDTTVLETYVRVVSEGRIQIPNAFTPSNNGPNGGVGSTGINDVFIPVIENVIEYEMLVFNRWGQLLFQTKDVNIGWDGYYNGQLSKADVYTYKITVKFKNNNTSIKRGNFTLLR